MNISKRNKTLQDHLRDQHKDQKHRLTKILMMLNGIVCSGALVRDIVALMATDSPLVSLNIDARVRSTEANFAECVYFFSSVMFYLLSLY